MTRYRTYLLDADDRVVSLVEDVAEDDGEALRTAGALRGRHAAAEVWRGERLVGRVGLDYAPFAAAPARAIAAGDPR